MVVFRLNKKSSIGVFDSGLGGLSVLDTLQKLLPNESYIYIGDSKNAPYGTKTKEEVLELSKQICDQLVSLDVKAIVIACNTATSAAVSQLREEYDLPIIGMEPAVKPALRQSTGKVAVLATEMTLKEEKFQKLIESLEDGYRIEKIPAPEWVACVENHMGDEPFVTRCVDDFLREHFPEKKNIVLGCTHYIFLKRYIQEFFNHDIEIFDGNVGTALQLKNTLSSRGLLNDSTNSELLKYPENVKIINTKSQAYVEKSLELMNHLRKERL